MKKFASVVAMLVLTAVSLVAFSTPASAEEVKMVGVITKAVVAADKKSVTVTLKDSKTAAEVVVVVTDELTIDKFGDKRIVEGDEIRVKYEAVDGKNMTKLFKKTAGC
ncbi:MAG: hypothetical protein HGB32_11255 [Geobacteraceae bacterium]|nr:hypothetical protein [Geobacteraceae bacterium]NTW80710.1 hypothetical protein [Geobacteraceae bacterium]